MAKVDRSILQANDQNMGDFGDPDKLEASITHLADKIDDNDDGFNSHKNSPELAHPDKSVTERKLADRSASSRVLALSSVLSEHLSPSLIGLIDDLAIKTEFDYRGVSVKSLGAIGDGASHPLSEQFPTLALAQMKYPHATALTDEIDWCAIQLAVNQHKNIFVPVGQYLINKTIRYTSPRTIKGADKNTTVIKQTTDNIAIFYMEFRFYHVSNLTLAYANQQTRANTSAIAIECKSVNQSQFINLYIQKANTGISSPDSYVNNAFWNNELNSVIIEHFSNIGMKLGGPGGSSGVIGNNIYISAPYQRGKSGLELHNMMEAVFNQLNIEGWYDTTDSNVGLGKYETPILVSGSRVIFNGINFEAISLVADNGYFTTELIQGSETSHIVANGVNFYNNRLNSADGITRACIVYTKQETFVDITGLNFMLFVKDFETREQCDVFNSLLITTTNKTRAEFTGVTGGYIVGTNDFNGSYGSLGFASTYTYVTNDDANLGVALQRVNNTIYTLQLKKELITPKITLTNGGTKFPSTEVPSTDPNTLDDYREGTFTGNVLFNGVNTGMTYTKNEGNYTKIGRMVFFTLQIILSAKGTSTGTVLINGLPYDSVKKHSLNVTLKNVSNINGNVQATTRDTTSKIMDFEIVTPTGVVVLTDANLTNTTEIIISGMYQR